MSVSGEEGLEKVCERLASLLVASHIEVGGVLVIEVSEAIVQGGDLEK